MSVIRCSSSAQTRAPPSSGKWSTSRRRRSCSIPKRRTRCWPTAKRAGWVTAAHRVQCNKCMRENQSESSGDFLMFPLLLCINSIHKNGSERQLSSRINDPVKGFYVIIHKWWRSCRRGSITFELWACLHSVLQPQLTADELLRAESLAHFWRQ